MVLTSTALRAMAAECRSIAGVAHDPAVRARLLEVAAQFERLAQERQLSVLKQKAAELAAIRVAHQ
jgi:hypothetical protein